MCNFLSIYFALFSLFSNSANGLTYYSVHFMTKEGAVKGMMGSETKLIKGEYLDSASEDSEDLSLLNDYQLS